MPEENEINIYVQIFCQEPRCKKNSELSGSTPLHLVSCVFCGSKNFSFYGEQKVKTNFTNKILELKKKSEFILPVQKHSYNEKYFNF
jgi:hypothetical protein